MANEEYLEILMQGVEVWNTWRNDHPEIDPILLDSGFNHADLGSTILSGAMLYEVNLCNANLSNADLCGADLRKAKLTDANLRGTILCKADLRNADLRSADFSHADLQEADLRGANLRDAYLSRVKLGNANLSSAILRDALLINADLSNAKLNDAVLRNSIVSGATLVNSQLRGAKLSGAKLDGADLRGANLSSVELASANLSGAKLTGVNLNDSVLDGSDLGEADLRGAKIINARLVETNLRSTDLQGADLTGADLSGAILNGVKLKSANVSKADADNTVFADVDLRKVNGLKSIRHHGRSKISISTVYRSEGEIPEVFLRGCGLRDWEVEATKLYRSDLSREQLVELTYKIIELRSDPLIQFNSCFISYSSADEEFAGRLYADLQNRGVRCWFAPEDMKIGDRIRNRLDDSIRLHDKLLLILSKTSVASQWIEQEVETALEKEREQGCDVLFPVRLDDAVMSLRSGWPALIRKTRHIGDFCRWDNPDEYKKALKRLLDDLRV